ncbi:MAG: helix-turn-helix transcriptional regulator [Bacteroidota bacterium]
MGEIVEAPRPVGSAALIQATVSQDLRRVPIFEHCLVLVEDGAKELLTEDGATARLAVGDVALLLAGGQPTIGNRPDPAAGRYAALVVAPGHEAVAAFRHHYPELARPPASCSAPWQLCLGDAALPAALRHAAAGLNDGGLSQRVALHRCVEVLAALAERGLFLPAEAEPGAAAVIRALVAARPHLPWTSADAARALGVSEPTLRRRLAAEGTSFRQIAVDVRLTHGLMLLQTTRISILEIALACGYESPSRFATRFRERFGMSPSELRG